MFSEYLMCECNEIAMKWGGSKRLIKEEKDYVLVKSFFWLWNFEHHISFQTSDVSYNKNHDVGTKIYSWNLKAVISNYDYLLLGTIGLDYLPLAQKMIFLENHGRKLITILFNHFVSWNFFQFLGSFGDPRLD
jgi:hypothetical protein